MVEFKCINGTWPSGKATGFGPVYRRFESYRPSHSEREARVRASFRFSLDTKAPFSDGSDFSISLRCFLAVSEIAAAKGFNSIWFLCYFSFTMNERNTRLINLVPTIFFVLAIVCVLIPGAQLLLAVEYLVLAVIIASVASLALAMRPNNHFQAIHALNGLLLALSALAAIALFHSPGFSNNWF
jgi:hypothetical protein